MKKIFTFLLVSFLLLMLCVIWGVSSDDSETKKVDNTEKRTYSGTVYDEAYYDANANTYGHRADEDGWSWPNADRPSSRPVGEYRQILYPAAHETGSQMSGLREGHLSGSGPEAEKILLGPLP